MRDTLSHIATESVILAGFAREGWSSYRFLRRLFPDKKITVVDEKLFEDLPSEYQDALKNDANANYLAFTPENEEVVGRLAEGVILKTPGIPPTSKLLQTLTTKNHHTSSNLELFLEIVRDKTAYHYPDSLPQERTVIGVTGTKGKSTTTSMIYHVLKDGEVPVVLGGNIGVPPLDLLEKVTGRRMVYVLEMSSHQLSEVSISPDIAVVQHVSPEHLDYYRDFSEYLAAKAHITRFQAPSDLVIFNAKSPTAEKIALTSQGQKIGFVFQQTQIEPVPDCEAEIIALATPHQLFYRQQLIINRAQVPLLGDHNLLNVLPSIIIAKHLGIASEVIADSIENFVGLDHRLEFVASTNRREYFNDSLATTPEATRAAVKAMGKRAVVLIAGGMDRQLELAQYQELGGFLAEHVVGLVLFPETGELIKREVQNHNELLPIVEVTTMESAVAEATRLCPEKGVVLLSPAAASFNLFKDYQDRGDQFKAAVLSLSESQSGT